MLTALSGAQPGPAGSIASTASSRLAYTHVTQVFDDIRAQRQFVRELEQDPFRNTPDDDLLTGLRGKDVLLVFVESYGRTALDLPVVESALDAGERRLQQAGFSSRSGFLTSPTFGGLSWLAHITLQSGLWVDDQGRYDHLSTLDRLTLTDAFGRAGWRTVAVVPANEKDWPMATTFYHYDQVWNALNVGYVGPRFGYAPVPDQYTLAAFQRLELEQPNRAPVMAEIDLLFEPRPLGAVAAVRRLEQGRGQRDLRSDAGAGQVDGRGIVGSRPGQSRLRRIRRLHTRCGDLVRAAAPRPERCARRPRRPPAGAHRLR